MLIELPNEQTLSMQVRKPLKPTKNRLAELERNYTSIPDAPISFKLEISFFGFVR